MRISGEPGNSVMSLRLPWVRFTISSPQQHGTGRKGGNYSPDEELIPMTVPEVRRLFTRFVWTETSPPDFVLYWSWWTRRHQARARQCHYKRRLSNLRL